MFPLLAIQGLAKFDALRNARRWKIKMCREDLFLTTRTFKNGRILLYKASPVFWTMFCTCSKTPTTWSKKCIISVLPFFSAGDSPQRHLRCLFFVVDVRRIKKKIKKKCLACLVVGMLVGMLASFPWQAKASHCAVYK